MILTLFQIFTVDSLVFKVKVNLFTFFHFLLNIFLVPFLKKKIKTWFVCLYLLNIYFLFFIMYFVVFYYQGSSGLVTCSYFV